MAAAVFAWSATTPGARVCRASRRLGPLFFPGWELGDGLISLPMLGLTRGTGVKSVGLVLPLALVFTSCGGPSGSTCPLENWSGTCGLTNFAKVREVEMPVPHAVYEAIYTPMQNPALPNYTPPPLRLEVSALSKHELALQEHMRRYSQLSCQQTIKEGCSYNPVVATLPEFNPLEYASAAEETGPQGCAKIEEQSVNGAPEIGNKATEALPDRFFFPKNISDPDPKFTPLAASVAQKLAADPSIECVGVVGQSASGESPGLAELRAQTVKRLLLGQGVPAYKMMTVSTSTPLFGTGNEPQPAKPEDMKVSITIILRSTAGPAPAAQ